MAPHLILLRHADSPSSILHPTYPDPALNPLGEIECTHLHSSLSPCFTPSNTLLVSSPLTRALRTATLTFPSLLPAIALPDLQEVSSRPCDTGRSLQTLKQEFKEGEVDWSHMGPGWEDKNNMRNRPCPRACTRRAKALYKWLEARPEEWIIVVGHGGLFRYLTNDWEDMDAQGQGWGCGEYREFGFVGEGEWAELVETGRSRAGRGARGERLGEEEQEGLRSRTEEMWRTLLVRQGFGVEAEWEKERSRRASSDEGVSRLEAKVVKVEVEAMPLNGA